MKSVALPRSIGKIDRYERLEILLLRMRDQPGVTAEALAAEAGVSVRTIFRDLGVLRRRGYAIEAAPGRGGGLRVPAAWSLARMQLAPDQGLLVLVALALALKQGLPLFARHGTATKRKLVGAFPPAARRGLGALADRVFVGSPASEAVRGATESIIPGSLAAVERAFVAERTVEITYEDSRGRRTSRTVEPHALVIRWPVWYLVAVDVSLAAARLLRLDRIRACVAGEDRSFKTRPHEVMAELDLYAGPSLR